MLEASYRNIPDPSDSERPKHYVPRNAYPTHASFPDKPLAIFENPSMFEKVTLALTPTLHLLLTLHV